MDGYKFNFDAAQQTLQEMGQISAHIEEALKDLERNVEKSLELWTGAARSQYGVSKQIWDNQANQMNTSLVSAQNALNNIHENYSETERRNASMWGDPR